MMHPKMTIRSCVTRITELEQQLKTYKKTPQIVPPLVDMTQIKFNPPSLIDRVEFIRH